MPKNSLYLKGTIKIKTADGSLKPFMPNTDISNVSDTSNGGTFVQTISSLNERISDAASKGGIKVMYEEPDAENTASLGGKTLIGYVPPETWQFQVKANSFTSKKASVPVYLYNQPGITLYVDWGDGSTSTLTADSYTQTDGSASIHTYAEAKVYTISITSSDWSKLYLYACSNITGSANTGSSPAGIIGCFRYSLYKILTPIPKIKGTQYYSNTPYSTVNVNNSFTYLFASCSYAKRPEAYPANLFQNNKDAVSFKYCFAYNGNVIIPKNIFKGMSSATDFEACFYYSVSLNSIPAGLFDDCISAQNFGNCFRNCLTGGNISDRRIPEGLFDKCTLATNFEYCFGNSGVKEIPPMLFYKNTEALNFSFCFYDSIAADFTLHIGSRKVSSCGSFVKAATSAHRTIYVPMGSATESNFNSVASSLALTVIGE